MPPQFLASYAPRVWCNSVRLSQVFDSFDVDRQADAIDTTVIEDRDKTAIAGQRMGDVGMGGLKDASTGAIDMLLADALGSTTPQKWTLAPAGPTIGKPALIWQAVQSEFTVKVPASDKVATDGGSQPTGRIMSGLMLLDGTLSKTGTSNQVTTTGAAASTAGGAAHFHLTDMSTLTSITVKVQHSSASAGSYTDLATFTSTGLGQAHSTWAGATKRYVRAAITAFTGGAAKSVKCAVAFARN